VREAALISVDVAETWEQNIKDAPWERESYFLNSVLMMLGFVQEGTPSTK